MTTPFLGSIKMFGGNFPPRGYAFCFGQTVAISQNDVLFSLLGTTYGGDGQTTFNLPDLRGRSPLHFGALAGGSSYSLGQKGGVETVTLTTEQMPAHTHTLGASTALGTSGPAGAVWARSNASQSYAASPNVAMSPNAVGVGGGNQPHENRSPYLAINFIIALEGIFPSRN